MFSSTRVLLLAVASLALTHCGSDSTNPASTDEVPAPALGSGGLTEYFGGVESVGADSLTVGGRVFMITEQTVVSRQGAAIPLADLHVGDPVVVKAKPNARGQLVASEVRVRVDTAQEMKFTGTADSVTPPDLVVAGRLVHTASNTEYTGTGNLVDIRPGYLVTVTGTRNDDGSVSAEKIRLEAKD